ncbi:hypothetical protein [Adhaeribacter rhizoryzae]|uniref:Uncharacterized protein n=1 Tax=Adhaeribacter rhizoryzae TaxID=2607907 RepID=A0A5M6DFK6_9BACT|nr:hypothetical protein [Adhaeribacter rhizoryzae]KAA5545062.1 hypothetical protein F0145_13495 [Adhaeribacter rhizoryzae]
MGLNPALEAKLAKPQTASARIDDNFRGKDITFITDKAGQAITLFIGKRNPDGSITGERYVRHLQYAPNGITVIKSHWDNKGKVTRA